MRWLLFLLLLTGAFLLPEHTFAQANFLETLDQTEVGIYGESDQSPGLASVIGTVIQAVMGILGVLLFVIMVYSGFLWMTAGGNTDQVEKAKAWVTNAIIGLVILLFAYVVSSFIVNSLTAIDSTSADTAEEASTEG